MNIAAILLVALLGQAPAQTPNTLPAPTTDKSSTKNSATHAPASTKATYTSEELGLSFDYPKDWKTKKVKVKNAEAHIVLTDPKTWRPANQDITTRFLLPLPGADEKGVLEIYSATFNQDQDTWQTVQRDINEKMNRAVLRQWTEEVLGVPMLMTKIESKDKGLDLITETGMLYSATPRKMIYRLSASPDNFDKADTEWRTVMQSLRTTDGQLPASESPGRPMTPKDLTPGAYHKVVWTPPAPSAQAPYKGNLLGEGTAAGKKVLLKGAGGWKVTKNSDGTFTVSSEELTGSAKLFIASVIDSDDPGKVLIRASGQTLVPFTKVLKREERDKFLNRGQSVVDWIYRKGVAATAPHFSFDAAGTNGDNYWVLTWNSGSEPNSARDRKALEGLVDTLTVVPGS
jgi:hypothetical protein